MSAYTHRTIAPPTQSRFAELLDNLRSECDQLIQDAMAFKTQRDDYELKMKSQIQEMSHMQQSLANLERAQHAMQQQYSEEMTRLRQQVEQYKHHVSSNPDMGDGVQKGQVQPLLLDTHSHHHHLKYSNGPSPILTTSPYAPSHPNPAPRQSGIAPLQRTPPTPTVTKRSADVAHSEGSSDHVAKVSPGSSAAPIKVEGKDWYVLFNPKTPRSLKVDLVHSFDHDSPVCSVKFSADGRYFAAGCNQATFVYDITTAARVAVLRDESLGHDTNLYIRSISFTYDGKYLATGAEDKQIRIWDIEKQQIRCILQGHEQNVYSLEFSRHNEEILVSGSGDETVRIWNWTQGRALHILRTSDLDDHRHKDTGMTSVALSPDGSLVAAGSLDKVVRVWDVATGQLVDRLEGHKDSAYSVAFTPDGKTLVSGSLDKTVRLYRLGGGKASSQVLSGHKDYVLSVDTTPDGKWIVSGSKDRGVQFWDIRTGSTQFMLQGHKNSVISVAASPGRRPLFASGSGDNRARIWSFEALNA